ncbi:hypothetical protein [Paraferrimonas sp. SM1919]|uniref:hypothetical protein n=1 Tax=Paraferrimonas sp. SM1919 TaxID=2662263 RepID=UPI0013CFBD0B|nr:hypothetical protein [Paraferrimonas sp. SM1919]
MKQVVVPMMLAFSGASQASEFNFRLADNDSLMRSDTYLKIVDTKTGQVQYIKPGLYKLNPGSYTTSLYVAELDYNQPSDSYQIVRDNFTISKGQKIVRNYQAPLFRQPQQGQWTLALLGGGALLGDSVQVPNVKYLLDMENIGQSKHPEMVNLADSPFESGFYAGGTLFSSYRFQGSSWHIEAAASFNNAGGALSHLNVDAGMGYNWLSDNWSYWLSAGVQQTQTSISGFTVITPEQNYSLTGSASEIGGYISLGFTPKDGGIMSRVVINPVNQTIGVQIGWNFGGNTQGYKLSQTTNYN